MDKVTKANETRKQNKVVKWCFNHAPELIIAGVAIGSAAIGIRVGYTRGIVNGKIEASKYYRGCMPHLIDRCGYYGFEATLDAIEKTSPDVYNNVCKLLDETKVNIARCYYDIPYIRNLLAEYNKPLPSIK